MLQQQSYDYVFLGAGCASLSIIMRMVENGNFADKRILLFDKVAKIENDRTWCYWEKGEGFFEPVVNKKWDTISFFSDDYCSDMDIAPYCYKMIRGADFYKYCFDKISQFSNIEIVYISIDGFSKNGNKLSLTLNGNSIVIGAGIVFNSIIRPAKKDEKFIELLQHFKGWVIETSHDVFSPAMATMMDFRVAQDKGTTFAYVLPVSSRKALVEYTLFTRELLPKHEYDEGLKKYISSFIGITDFTLKEEEFGVIPMSSRKFSFEENGIYNVGTAGGQTKGSSGYTFQFIQKQSQQIADALIAKNDLKGISFTPRRFRFYDNVLLNILYHNKLPGDKIFSRLFKRNKPQQVLKFLDNETSLAEELKIISTLPTMPFLKSAFKQI